MTFQLVLEQRRAHLPEGDWCVLAEEHQSRLLLKTPSSWSIDNVTLLPLTSVQWEVAAGNRLEPSIGLSRLAPVELADYLYDHQDRIPVSWREKDILFWTIFENREPDDPCGNRFVCSLTYAAATARWMRLYVPIRSEWTLRDVIALVC